RRSWSGVYRYSFPAVLDAAGLSANPDLVVHNAFEMGTGATQNLAAAKFLLDCFAGRRFCFISSISAPEEASSRYGREKFAIEKMMAGHLIVRPGFILGPGGVFQRLVRSIASLPILPLFYGGDLPIHTVHVEDVARGVIGLVQGDHKGVFPL